MSILIMSEVMRTKHTRLATRLVLLAMADAANDAHRMCWESVGTIASKANIQERQTYNVLRDLEQRRIIEKVPEEEKPREAARYRSVVRRILPVEEWLPEPDKGAENAPAENAGSSCEVTTPEDPANFASLHPSAPNPNSSTIGSKEVRGTSYLQGDALEEEPPTRPGSKGWKAVQPLRGPGGKRKSRKQEALDQAAAERELDPAYVVAQALGDGDPADSLDDPLPASDDDLAPQARRRRAPRSKRPSEKLAEYFERLARDTGSEVPGTTNKKALIGSFGRWMDEGTDQTTIRQMIETYWSDSWQRAGNDPAWRDFLNARGLLIGREAKVQKIAETEARRYDEDYWGKA